MFLAREAVMNRTAVLLLVAGVVTGAIVTPVLLRLPGSGATAQPQSSTTYRWLDTEITLPASAAESVSVARMPPPQPGMPWRLIVSDIDDPKGGELHIDAQSSSVISDTLSASDPALADAIVASLRRVSDTPKVWPYADQPVPAETLQWARVEVVKPDPASGIEMFVGSGYCRDRLQCVSEFIEVLSGSARMMLNAETGEVRVLETFDGAPVPEPEYSAFMRWAESAKILPEPTPQPETPTVTATPGAPPTAIAAPSVSAGHTGQ
jgi:hypothetical protein